MNEEDISISVNRTQINIESIKRYGMFEQFVCCKPSFKSQRLGDECYYETQFKHLPKEYLSVNKET